MSSTPQFLFLDIDRGGNILRGRGATTDEQVCYAGHEMTAFVALAKKLDVYMVRFDAINNWGTFTREEYLRPAQLTEIFFPPSHPYRLFAIYPTNTTHYRSSAMNNKTRDFYNTIGWSLENGISQDTARWEDLRSCSASYVHKCRMRPYQHVPRQGEFMLDVGSGPLDDAECLSYSDNFKKRYCVDFSQTALDRAKSKLGDRGEYICQDFLDVSLPANYFDCSLSYCSLFHVESHQQATFVRKMLLLTKPMAPVIITYSNHDDLVSQIPYWSPLIRDRIPEWKEHPYYYSHPLQWWNQFKDEVSIELHPLRTLNILEQKALIPDSTVGEALLDVLYASEEARPDFFVRWGHYYTVVLRKPPAK